MKKKVLSLFLALLMVLTVMPLAVFTVGAGETEGGEEAAPVYTYEDLYVPGMSVLLTAYNPAEDGIVLENGDGTWANKVEGSDFAAAELYGHVDTFTGLDGKSYTSGWQAGENSVYFNMAWQIQTAHGVKVPSSLFGDTYTVELVAKMNGMTVATGNLGKYWNVDGSKDENGNNTFTAGDKPEVWGDLMFGKNYILHYKFTFEYDGQNMKNLLPSGELYAGYTSDGIGNAKWFRNNGDITSITTDKVVNYFITEEALENNKVSLYWSAYAGGILLEEQGGGVETRDGFDTEGEYVTFFSHTPANVYAIRIYKDKVLTEAERNQNHFADLCAYFGVSSETIGKIKADPALFTTMISKFAGITFENGSKEAIESAVDKYIEDLASAAEAKVYASLYVEGATVMLNVFGSDVLLSGGAGTWKDAITGETVATLNGTVIEVGGTIKKVVTGETANQEIFHTYQMEHKDANGNPLYRVTTNIWVDKTIALVNNKTYTKGNETYTVTKHETIVEGWNGTAYSVDTKVALGGWYVAADGGLRYDLPDFFQGTALGNYDAHSIYIGTGLEYLPEDEYTVEITMNAGYITDTDGYQYTNCNAVAWEGEPGSWQPGAIRLGALNFYNRPGTPTGAQVKGSLANAFVHYSSWSDGGNSFRFGDNLFAKNFFQKQNSTMAITKAATGDGNYTYSGYVNGIAPFAGFTTGTTHYPNGSKEVVPYIPNEEVQSGNFGLSTWNQFTLFNNAPVTVYAIRVYDKVLNSAEMAQNHFADLASYYKLDVSKVLELKLAGDTDTLALIYNASNAYAIGTSSREEIQNMVDAAIESAAARRQTMKYAALYAPGATAILLAYNAKNDGSITITNGSGTWVNLVNGEAYTLLGQARDYQVTQADGSVIDYSTGWTIGEKSVGYVVSNQEVQAGYNHYIQIPASVLGDAFTSTTEIVSARVGMHFDNSGRNVKIWDKDKDTNPGLSYGDDIEMWGELVRGKNFNMHYKTAITYEEGMTLTTIPSKENYNAYTNDGNWPGKSNIGATFGGLAQYDLIADRIVLMDTNNGDGATVSTSLKYYSDANTTFLSAQRADVAIPTGSRNTMDLFVNVPADVYAIRTYDRNLNEAELLQNHFADLCAYFALDIKNLALLDADSMLGLYAAFATYTFANANAADLQAILDGTVAELVDSPIRFQGVSGRLEDYAAIRGTFTFSAVEQQILAAKGLEVVDFGAIVAIADGITMSDLTVSFDGTATTASTGVFALASNLNGMSYNYALDGVGVVYTLSVTYNGLSGDQLKSAYETDLIYRGYIILADEAGELYTLYTDGVTETFGDSASMKDVAEALLANEAYADNEILAGVIDACTPVPAAPELGE